MLAVSLRSPLGTERGHGAERGLRVQGHFATHPGETLRALPSPGRPLPCTRSLGLPVPNDNVEGQREPRESNHTQGAVPSCVVPPRGQLPVEMRYKNLEHEGETGDNPHSCRSSNSPSLARLPFMKMTPRITKRRLSLGVSLVLKV